MNDTLQYVADWQISKVEEVNAGGRRNGRMAEWKEEVKIEKFWLAQPLNLPEAND